MDSLTRALVRNFLDWDAGSYAYNRATLDSRPYQIVKSDDKKSSIVFNALGISKEDIKVEVVRDHGVDYLTINGETKNIVLNKTYSVAGRFSLDGERIESIEWITQDGILTVDVNFKEPEPSTIKIVKK